MKNEERENCKSVAEKNMWHAAFPDKFQKKNDLVEKKKKLGIRSGKFVGKPEKFEVGSL